VSIEYRIGDVFERLAEIPDGSVDLIVTSPPFLALRSYLPADHPDKAKEIGSEPTPAEFIDTLLALTAEWGRVLTPHGSLCVELGDTFSGSGGAGGDWIEGSGQRVYKRGAAIPDFAAMPARKGNGWPLSKSLTGIPTLYPWSLAYGRNLLRTPMTAHEALDWIDRLRAHGWSAEHALSVVGSWVAEHGPGVTIDPWRIRNVIVWARPNPPVGALGDKFRPATSYITVACKGQRRYFDLDAVRTPHTKPDGNGMMRAKTQSTGARADDGQPFYNEGHPAGAPPLDWHTDNHPEDGDWLWKLSTRPYKGSHYATFPLTLPRRLIEAMCPQRVCVSCGKPSERITEVERVGAQDNHGIDRRSTTLGWSDCGHNTWRTGTTLDPFAGSGTTLEAAQAVGRHAIGIDLDSRNAELARDRVGMFLTVVDAA
jgi:DNA modification methylase